MVFLAVDFDSAAEGAGEGGGAFHGSVDGCGVLAGGLDLDEIAEAGEEPGGFCFDGFQKAGDVHGRRL